MTFWPHCTTPYHFQLLEQSCFSNQDSFLLIPSHLPPLLRRSGSPQLHVTGRGNPTRDLSSPLSSRDLWDWGVRRGCGSKCRKTILSWVDCHCFSGCSHPSCVPKLTRLEGLCILEAPEQGPPGVPACRLEPSYLKQCSLLAQLSVSCFPFLYLGSSEVYQSARIKQTPPGG